MGPMSSLYEDRYRDREARLTFIQRHEHCRSKRECIGPGCVYVSGKTEKRNKKRSRR